MEADRPATITVTRRSDGVYLEGVFPQLATIDDRLLESAQPGIAWKAGPELFFRFRNAEAVYRDKGPVDGHPGRRLYQLERLEI